MWGLASGWWGMAWRSGDYQWKLRCKARCYLWSLKLMERGAHLFYLTMDSFSGLYQAPDSPTGLTFHATGVPRCPGSTRNSWPFLKSVWELYQGQDGARFTNNNEKKILVFYSSGSQSLVPRQAAAAVSPENWLEMQILRPCQSSCIRNSRSNLGFNKAIKQVSCSLRFETHNSKGTQWTLAERNATECWPCSYEPTIMKH